MKQNVREAMSAVDTTYQELIVIANDIFQDVIGDLDIIMSEAYNNVENLSNDTLRYLMTKLSLRSYSFSEIKEKSLFKTVLAETLRKEAYAKNYNEASGTCGTKENIAIMNSSSEIVAEEIYSLVSSMFKTKIDEVHRVVDTLKTVLMSRLSEAKLSNVNAE